MTPALAVLARRAAEMPWIEVRDGNETAAALFRRHYTYRRTRDQISLFWQRNRNRNLIAGPGEKLVLLTPCGRAVFVWRKFISMDKAQTGINCAVFRNEGAGRSSDLIRVADMIAWNRWPDERHYTYVKPSAIRSSNPGYCFIKAGWRRLPGLTSKGLRVLEITRRDADLDRCEREQQEILSRPDVIAGAAPAWLVTLGLEDWEMEKRLIVEGVEPVFPMFGELNVR